MKNVLLYITFLVCVISGAVRAQTPGDSVLVPIKVYVTATGNTTSGNEWLFALVGPNDPHTYLSAGTSSSGENRVWQSSGTGECVTQMIPGKPYGIALDYYRASGYFYLAAPPGYSIEVSMSNGTHYSGAIYRSDEKNTGAQDYGWQIESGTITLHPLQPAVSQVGTASSIGSGQVFWQVSLGTLQSGGSAGFITLADPGDQDASYWPQQVFSRGALQYVAPSAEIKTYRDSSAYLRQIVVNQAIVDITAQSSTAYTISFYSPGDATYDGTAAVAYSFGSNKPFVSYKVEQVGTGASLKITQTTYAKPTDTSPARTAVTTLSRVLSADALTWTWTKDDWTTSGNPVVAEEVRTWTRTTYGRTENIQVGAPSGSSVATLSKQITTYGPFYFVDWITVGTTNSVKTDFDYYKDSTQIGSYGYVKSRKSTDGSWVGYDYYEVGTDPSYMGTVHHVYHPHGDQAFPANLSTTTGAVTSFTYELDAFGSRTRPSTIVTTVDNKTTAKSVFSYASATATVSGATTQPLVIGTETASTNSSGAALVTTRKSFREDADDSFFTGRPYAVINPDHTQESFAYQRGSLSISGSTVTFTVDSAGAGSRVAVISGSDSGGNATKTDENGFTIESIHLTDGKSTKVVTYRDSRALVRAVQRYVWSSPNWVLLQQTIYTYDWASNLTDVATSDGTNPDYATYGATYSGLQKQDETDPTGVKTTFTYDDAGRIYTVTKVGAGDFGDLKTTYSYDAAGRVKSVSLSAPGATEVLTSTQEYDDSGRVISMSKPGQPDAQGTGTKITVGYSYDPAAKMRTVTLPNGGSRIETYNADGTLYSITGSGVAAYYTYDVNTDGSRYMKLNVGSKTSARFIESWQDWVGRPTKKSLPGFDTQPALVESNNFNDRGQLAGTSYKDGNGTKLKADTLNHFDDLGQLSETALHLDTSATDIATGTKDRVVDVNLAIELYQGSWWLTKTVTAYPTKSSTATKVLSRLRKRVTGLGADNISIPAITGKIVEEEIYSDVNGMITDRTVVLDRASATQTIKTSLNGVSGSKQELLVNGLSTQMTDFDGLIYKNGFDSLQRPYSATDPRTGTSYTYYYSGTTMVWYVKDTAANQVALYTYDAAGRIASVKDANGKISRTEYNQRDQVVHQWGDTTYPVEYGYDTTYGDRITMRTFRGGSNWSSASTAWPTATGTGDWTRWTYDAATGLLAAKYDAANLDANGQTTTTSKGVKYTYNARRQLASRTWARGTVTKYHYYGDSDISGDLTGELQSVEYVDGGLTPGVTYTYTRAGDLDTVKDYTGTRTFGYNAAGASPSSHAFQLDSVTFDAFYGNRVITRKYNATYRPIGFKVGSSYDSSADVSQLASYDAANGRYDHIDTSSSASGGTRTITYSYFTFDSSKPTSPLLGGYSSGSFSVCYDYEPNRDLLKKVDSTWASASQTRYDYTYNALGQRKTTQQSGAVFADFYEGAIQATTYNFNYNDRGELTDAADYLGTDVANVANQMSGRHFSYDYDSVGNRKTVSRNGTAGIETYAMDATHAPLNQYSSRTNSYAHVAGTVGASNISAAVADSGGYWPVAQQGRYWNAQIGQTGSGPTKVPLTVRAMNGAGSLLTTDTTRQAWMLPATQTFGYDADGNMQSDGMWSYGYDAENRLVTMTPVATTAGYPTQLLNFAYDYLGRRVEKKVATWNGAQYALTYATRFLYDGDNLVAEFSSTSGSCGAVIRSYTWGLDVTGSLDAAGGIGGLIQITDHATNVSYFPTYDGNGNVVSLVQANDGNGRLAGAVVAKYEYSPYGELLRCSGIYATTNPFRFSTKYMDQETGLVDYGARYYSPSLGRFINRDPIEEAGGINLYGFCQNDGVNGWDYLGYDWTISQPYYVSTYTYLNGVLAGVQTTNYTATATLSDWNGSTGGKLLSWNTGGGPISITQNNAGSVTFTLPGAGSRTYTQPIKSTPSTPTTPTTPPVTVTTAAKPIINNSAVYPAGAFDAKTSVEFLRIFAPDSIYTADRAIADNSVLSFKNILNGSYLDLKLFGVSEPQRRTYTQWADSANIGAAERIVQLLSDPEGAKTQLEMQFLTEVMQYYTGVMSAPLSFARIPGAPAPKTGPYRQLTAELKGTGQQANHLNQDAAFGDVIPSAQGEAIGMRGNAFTEPATPHYRFHASLERFWNQYRRGGSLAGSLPTNAEYGQALRQALIDAGLSPAAAERVSAAAAANRAKFDLKEVAPVPRIPGRMNQKKGP